VALIKLHIENFRNLLNVQLAPSPSINYISGPNGSGKTSILEAIYVIGRGRSFRSNRVLPVINHNANHLQVFAESDMGEKKSKIGVRRSAKETLVKIDGSIIRKMSDIAVHTPVQIITPKSHEMLERGPEFRRRFVEWGVFHVEHSYTHLHKRFLRVLEQRNATLKRGDDSIQLWDREFVKAGEDLNSTRFRYFQGFLEIFDEEKQLFGLDDV